jgi:hypothetical protein
MLELKRLMTPKEYYSLNENHNFKKMRTPSYHHNPRRFAAQGYHGLILEFLKN